MTDEERYNLKLKKQKELALQNDKLMAELEEKSIPRRIRIQNGDYRSDYQIEKDLEELNDIIAEKRLKMLHRLYPSEKIDIAKQLACSRCRCKDLEKSRSDPEKVWCRTCFTHDAPKRTGEYCRWNGISYKDQFKRNNIKSEKEERRRRNEIYENHLNKTGHPLWMSDEFLKRAKPSAKTSGELEFPKSLEKL